MARTTLIHTLILLCVLPWLSACGDSSNRSPQSPQPIATPAPRALIAGTSLTVVSGEDDAPVSGATVILAGREYVSDGAGQVVLPEDLPYGSFVDIVASGFLSRQTVVRADGSTRFVLWPRETASGMNEAFPPRSSTPQDGRCTPSMARLRWSDSQRVRPGCSC